MRNARFSLGQTKASVALVEERFKANAATSTDVTNAHLQLDETNLAIDRAVEGFAHSKRMLLLTAGLSGLSDDTIPEEIPKPVYSAEAAPALMEDFVREGVNKTFLAQVYDCEIRQSDLNYKVAKHRQLYPRFDLQMGASDQNQTNASANAVSQVGVLSEYVGVGASMDIFDGFATRGAKLAALASKRSAERNRQNYLDQTLEQARNLEQQVEFSDRALAITEKHFELSEESLQRARDNLKLGTSSQADVDQATASFYQWQAAVFGARADFLSNWSSYLSLLGIDPVLNNLPASFTSNAK